MEEEIDLAGDFGANGTVAPEVVVEAPEPEVQQPVTHETPPQEQEDRSRNRVPLAEYLSEREKRQELERQLRAFQQQKPDEKAKPDFWENPEDNVRRQASEVTRQAMDPVQQSLSFNNRLIAGSVLGKDAVDAAEVAFNAAIKDGKMDPAVHARINNHPNPFHAAVEWHKQQLILEKTGGDLTAYETKLLEEKLKDPEFLAKAVAAHQSTQQQTRAPSGQFGAKPTTIIRPPSLNRATGSTTASAGDDTEEDMAGAFGAR